MFTLTSDVEESSTRSESISLDYEFYHSHIMPLECGNDYSAKIIPRDINIWISRLFLGDSDGFSILYYQDVDSLISVSYTHLDVYKRQLITIQQMVVRSEEDIRKISQELYNLIQSGSRAQGHFTTA